MAKKYKCPYCNDKLIRKDLINHINKKHEDMIPGGYTSERLVFDIANNSNGHGNCRVCGRPTTWNQKSGRYNVLCDDPACKEKMREDYKKNMVKVYGTYNILTSDEQQKKMLANRSISGKYKFKDGGVLTYTGSYERKFLEFADKVMEIDSKDIMAPGPTIEYIYNGEKHFYITDFLYIPYNAIIEIKDGGSNPNNKDSVGMRSSRERTLMKEKIITDKGEYHYLRLTDNNFMQLLEFFMDIKKSILENDEQKIIKINESSFNTIIRVESMINNIDNLSAFHLEICDKDSKLTDITYKSWDEELYCNNLLDAVSSVYNNNNIFADVFTAGSDLVPKYLGRIEVLNKNTYKWYKINNNLSEMEIENIINDPM